MMKKRVRGIIKYYSVVIFTSDYSFSEIEYISYLILHFGLKYDLSIIICMD